MCAFTRRAVLGTNPLQEVLPAVVTFFVLHQLPVCLHEQWLVRSLQTQKQGLVLQLLLNPYKVFSYFLIDNKSK